MTIPSESAMEKKDRVARRIEADPHAPHYHFVAPDGDAMPSDPNGALYWKGRYHLFYIFQNPALPHGGHCWGHASSGDLVHWTFHPGEIVPAPGDPEKGIFSGNAFVSKEGVPTLAYYGIDAGLCLAQSTDDDLNTWSKFTDNPVIPVPKEGDPGWGVYNVFDPHIWLEGDTYCAILGGNVKPREIRDTAYLFHSRDLVHWEYSRHFYTPRAEWTDELEDCACPDFFELGNRHMLLCISHSHGARYYLGRYEDGVFVPEEHHRMNWPGGSCFAPESLVDDKGRRIFWSWVLDQRRGEGDMKTELGVMTLPRQLALDGVGRLLIQPPKEVESLRRNPRLRGSFTLSPGHDVRLEGFDGDVMELGVRATVPSGGLLGVRVRTSPDRQEQTRIIVDTSSGVLSVDTTQTSLREDIFQPFPIIRLRGDGRKDVRVQSAPFALGADETLNLRIFLDKSILEVYANGRQCVTQRIYPTRADSLGAELFCERDTVVVEYVEAWDMAATNT